MPNRYSTTDPILVPPPGAALSAYHHGALSSAQPATIPRGFLDAMAVREPVYITEQGCSLANEVDADDARAWHWVVYAQLPSTTTTLQHGTSSAEEEEDDAGQRRPVATLRLIPPPHPPLHGAAPRETGGEPYVMLGRLGTLAAFRGRGLAGRMVEAAMAWAVAHADEVAGAAKEGGERGWAGLVLIHAQTGAAERWWGRLGFERDEGMGMWVEEGIDHVGMWRRVEVEDRVE